MKQTESDDTYVITARVDEITADGRAWVRVENGVTLRPRVLEGIAREALARWSGTPAETWHTAGSTRTYGPRDHVDVLMAKTNHPAGTVRADFTGDRS
jgi:hypothetical protein